MAWWVFGEKNIKLEAPQIMHENLDLKMDEMMNEIKVLKKHIYSLTGSKKRGPKKKNGLEVHENEQRATSNVN